MLGQLLSIQILLLPLMLWASDILGQGTYLGVRAGGNRSTTRIEVEGVRLENLGPELGTNFGVVAGYSFSDIIAIQTEVMYARHGVRAQDASGIELPQADPNIPMATIEANYLEIPLFLMVTALPERTFRPRFFAGPVFAFQTGCEATFSQGNTSTASKCEEVPIDIKSFDPRFSFGPGLLIDIRPQITFDVSYEQGFLDLMKDDGTEVTFKNNSWVLKLGLQFPLGW